MRWRRLRQSDRVQDRRGARTGAVAGGIGGLGIIGVLLALLLGGGGEGGGLEELLNQLGGTAAPAQESAQPAEYQGIDESEAFVRSVLGSTEDVWDRIFEDSGRRYPPPDLVLFTGSTTSACGGATSRIGPHYCPIDRTIYIDREFFVELESRFGASGGDFAEAYVIAHEVAHHVQHTLGIMDEMRGAQQQDPAAANSLSVSLELQADCFAGVWASRLVGVLEAGDIQEGLDAAAAVGDDRIQEAVTGRVTPENWTHGSSTQRVQWFTTGYETGNPNACDTF